MSASFVEQLRTKRPAITLAQPGPGAITFRVEASDIWDTVRVVAPPNMSVAEVKKRVVAELFPNDQFADDFVLKLRGWEVLDETSPLSGAGVVEGSILLLAYRRRRPVR